MADESVIIEVKDQVSSEPARKIRQIAKEALSAHSAVETLKKVLASINDSALNKISSSLGKSSAAALKDSIANERLEQQVLKTAAAKEKLNQAQQKTASLNKISETSSLKAAVAQERLSAQIQRTSAATMQAESALNRAVISETNATAATQRLATAKNQTSLVLQRNVTETKKTEIATTQAQIATTRAAIAETRNKITTEQLSAAKDRAAIASLRFANAQAQAEKNTTRADFSLRSMFRTFLLFSTLIGSGAGILTAADSYTVLQNKLQIVADSQRQVNELTIDLFEIANRTRAPVQETAQAFTRFDMALKTLGASQSETLRLTETINKSLIISGSTAQESASGLLQLSQAFNKGKLDGDEFRSVMELMPVVSQAIAKELKVTRGELLKLAPEGKITAEVMRAALANVASEVDSKFEKTTATIGQAFTVLKNNITQSFGEINAQYGLTNAFAELVIVLANNLDALALAAGMFATVLLVKMAPGLWASVAGFISANANSIRYQFTLARMAGYSIAAASATTTLGVALAAVTGPIGIIITALGVAAAALFYYKKQSNETKLVEEQRAEQVQKLADAYKQYSQQRFASEILTIQKEALAVDAQLIEKREALANANKQSIDNLNVLGGATKHVTVNTKDLQREIATLEQKQSELAIKTDAVNKVFEDGLPTVASYTDGMRLVNKTVIDLNNNFEVLKKVGSAIDGLFSGDVNLFGDPKQLDLINRQLDNQLSRMNAVGLEKEKQQMYDRFTEQMAKKNEFLSVSEQEALKKKIDLLVTTNALKEEEHRILDETVLKQEQYLRQLEAIQNLKTSGAINQGQASQAIIAANPDLDFSNTDTMFDAQAERFANMYSQIEELRNKDLISEQTASALKVRVWQQEQQQKFSTANTFLGELANLQNTKSKQMQRIGKAAAIGQAMISTYQSATSAYAAMAGIPFVGPALGIAAAAAAIAAGLANVNAIRSQPTGFMAGGYTGDAARTAVAGVVHGQEYVFDAKATSRIGVQNLEALRAGELAVDNFASPGKSSGGGGSVDARQFNLALNVDAMDARGVDGVILDRKDMIWQLMVEAANEQGREL